MVNERSVNEQPTREEAREASRGKILDAALSLFASHGFDGTSVRQIARRAGVSHGLLYAHFESKDDLLQELLGIPLRDVGESLAAGSGTGSPGERLERLALEGAWLVQAHLEVWRLCYAIRMQPPVLEAMAPWFTEWTEVVLEAFAGLFEEACMPEPAAEAQLFFAAFDGVCQHYALNPNHFPLEERVRALVTLWTDRIPTHGKDAP